MSTRKLSDAEWAAKADYEGGAIDAFDYGLTPDDLEDQDGEFAQEVRKVYNQWLELDDTKLLDMIAHLADDWDEW